MITEGGHSCPPFLSFFASFGELENPLSVGSGQGQAIIPQVRDMPFYQMIMTRWVVLWNFQEYQEKQKHGSKWDQSIRKSVDMTLEAMQRSCPEPTYPHFFVDIKPQSCYNTTINRTTN
ncbi:MAG: hypothetical protein V1749_07800 [Candidatus Desantisbacteria bacterium]